LGRAVAAAAHPAHCHGSTGDRGGRGSSHHSCYVIPSGSRVSRAHSCAPRGIAADFPLADGSVSGAGAVFVISWARGVRGAVIHCSTERRHDGLTRESCVKTAIPSTEPIGWGPSAVSLVAERTLRRAPKRLRLRNINLGRIEPQLRESPFSCQTPAVRCNPTMEGSPCRRP
jgi:hypothetical protein